ncbi:S-methyl-5-thioribose-1-phosphate isomerase [Phycicoccus sp. CSK15P-2]|uniref:S-methyl-5-thioribose-1-phosphate isomerase n=1 Tax=Phycicoccus sp. CSK15P-2 TaxID=2807627 RepID=UPI001951654E|nr:S-methyl-5-thioribose-1-phosphate isomerase [Phycicoccus sp. CSK15P-2]MBM6404101.1 S-methyl-5-thioribose-1-phosphate isomerase [Phycicoccus sp. CSK15P-2]
MTIRTISWDDTGGPDGRGVLRLLDQTLLPSRTEDRVVRDVDGLVAAIEELAVRGAPALGVAGAMGVLVALDQAEREGWGEERLQAEIDRVRHARPTAVNLAWGVDAVRPLLAQGREAVLAAARRVAAEDEAANRELSRRAADWLLARMDRDRVRVLTHCNAGVLAASAWGTALGVVRELQARGRLEVVYADETRPLLQGARLTAWELAAEGVEHRVQVDGAAASTVLRGLVDCAVVGADRVAANGDVANKIGTLAVGLACREAGIPLLVAAPWSTVDLTMADGDGIEIEERSGEEVTTVAGRRVAPEESAGFNPAFDVTPARFVSAVATERGVVEPAGGAVMSDLS